MEENKKKIKQKIDTFDQVPFDYRLLSLSLQLFFSRFGIVFICYLVACPGPVEVFPF